MRNCITAPFILILLSFKVRDFELHEECSEVWRVLKVTYPDDFPTSTEVQRFYFAANNLLLRRLDYEQGISKSSY